MKKIIVIILLLIMVGCQNKEKIATIEMTCNNIKTTINIKENNKVGCNLLDNDYEFVINKITDNKVELEVNKFGLTDNGNITNKNKIFILEKNNELKIHTQTTDYQQYVIFKRK